MSSPPRVEPSVLVSARILAGDPDRITHDEGADAAGDGPADDGLRGFVVRLVDSAAVPGFGAALRGADLAPSPAAALTAPGCLARHLALAGLAIGQVKAFLRAYLSSRNQQRLVTCGDREGVDDPEIDTCDPFRVKPVLLDWYRRGHIHAEPTGVDEQG